MKGFKVAAQAQIMAQCISIILFSEKMSAKRKEILKTRQENLRPHERGHDHLG
jgi:hypothetical protein